MFTTPVYTATVTRKGSGWYHEGLADGVVVEKRTSKNHQYRFWNPTGDGRVPVFSEQSGQVEIVEIAAVKAKKATAAAKPAKATGDGQPVSRARADKREATKRTKAAAAKIEGGAKTCNKCHEDKPATFEHFYIRADGTFCGHCRPCNRAMAKAKKVPVAA